MAPPPGDTPVFSWWDFARAYVFLLDKQRARYFGYTAVLVLVFFYDLVPIFVVGKVVDFFTNYTPGDSLTVFYAYIIFLTVTYAIFSFIRLSVKKQLGNVQSKVTYFTRVHGFERLVGYSLAWHDKENTGNKVQRIQNGTDSMNQIQDLLSNDLIGQVTSIVGVVIALLFILPPFSLGGVVFVAVFIIIQARFYRLLVEMTNANNILLERAGGTYYEGLNNVLTIKTLGAQHDFKKNIISREAMSRDFSMRRRAVSNRKWKTFQLVNALAVGGMLFIAGQSFLAGAISVGSIFVIYNYFQRLSGSVMQGTSSFERLINAKGGIARMMPIFWGDAGTHEGTQSFPSSWSQIKIRQASFAYPKKSPQEGDVSADFGLADLSVTIGRHQKIGVVGASGSGKSTFAKILLGLYPLSSGEFAIGPTAFDTIKRDDLTDAVALVLQESEMFNLSLKENITLMRAFDPARFETAVTTAQLMPLIAKLPEGIETLIGEKGYRLSGGERQRIGIARALYKNPQILVLDEATSSLDSKTEALIQKGLHESLRETTVISIAHRVSTLKDTDAIIVFSEGRIVEQGTYTSLYKNKESHFYQLNKQQQSGGRTPPSEPKLEQ